MTDLARATRFALRALRAIALGVLATLVSGVCRRALYAQPRARMHHTHRLASASTSRAAPPEAPAWNAGEDLAACLASAAAHARGGPRRVLDATRSMLARHTIVRGTCYTWTNLVYHRAGGHPDDMFHSTRRAPFVEASRIRPGDWVFFINHSFRNATHSAIFVRWIDERARAALVVSHPGGNRSSHGRFGRYDLSHVYRLVRMGDDPYGAPRNP